MDIAIICSRMIQGESISEIAADLGVNVETMRGFCSRPENEQLFARAKQLSAEAWLERGLKYALTSPRDPVEIQRARLLEQHCARRAALYDPAGYSERLKIDQTVTISPLQRAFEALAANGSYIPIGQGSTIESTAVLVPPEACAVCGGGGLDEGCPLCGVMPHHSAA